MGPPEQRSASPGAAQGAAASGQERDLATEHDARLQIRQAVSLAILTELAEARS
jgi:hypothetical protein